MVISLGLIQKYRQFTCILYRLHCVGKMASAEYYENSLALSSFRKVQWDAYSTCSNRSSFYQPSHVLHEDYFYQFYYGKFFIVEILQFTNFQYKQYFLESIRVTIVANFPLNSVLKLNQQKLLCTF